MILPSFRRSTAPNVWLATLVICFVVFAVGCAGGKRKSAEHVEVSGDVTYKGKPVTGGQLIFSTDDGFAANGVIDEKGHYTIKAPVGNVKIAVNNRMLSSGLTKEQKAATGKGAGKPGVEPNPIKGKFVNLPSKYSTPDTSGLTYTVKPEAQTHNIDLKDE